MVMQSLELSFKLFPLSSLLVNNVLDSVPLQLYMAINALNNNRLVLLPEVRESYSGGYQTNQVCYSYILSLPPNMGSWFLCKHFLQICLSPWKIRNNFSQRDIIKPCSWDSKTSRPMIYFSMTKGLISSSLQAIILWSTSHSKSQKSYWNWKVKALCGEWLPVQPFTDPHIYCSPCIWLRMYSQH